MVCSFSCWSRTVLTKSWFATVSGGLVVKKNNPLCEVVIDCKVNTLQCIVHAVICSTTHLLMKYSVYFIQPTLQCIIHAL